MNLSEIKTILQQKIVVGRESLKEDTLTLPALSTVIRAYPDGPEVKLTQPVLEDIAGPGLKLSGRVTVLGIPNATLDLTFHPEEGDVVPTLICTLPGDVEIDIPNKKSKLISLRSVAFASWANGEAAIKGEIGLGANAVKLPVIVDVSQQGVVWAYDWDEKPDAPPLDLAHLIDLFGADLAEKLPAPLQTITSLRLVHLEFSPTAALSPRLFPYITAKVKTTHPWQITSNFALQEFDLTITVSDPLSSNRSFWFEIEGDTNIEGTLSKLIVSGPEGPNRWRLRLEPGIKLEVSKLGGYVGGSSGAKLPTPSQHSATIQLDYLQVVAGLGGGESGVQSASLILTETGPWQIIPNKLELDQASLNLSVDAPMNPVNRRMNGTATAQFKVGSGDSQITINLSAQYQGN